MTAPYAGIVIFGDSEAGHGTFINRSIDLVTDPNVFKYCRFVPGTAGLARDPIDSHGDVSSLGNGGNQDSWPIGSGLALGKLFSVAGSIPHGFTACLIDCSEAGTDLTGAQ